ncbi:MAG: OB-fold nucleic acid binding domain-containing protein [Candidatus Rehaiarchaeum fermentans]|nr:OB-fold nucleic acid binding domain-containing protein [Candidatus Rehaiarchaeum fermentans]MCW1311754.1 OB-fold nucleic acid binding domain-containing protein [Candidatus Rehaiarchaeum fermentans]
MKIEEITGEMNDVSLEGEIVSISSPTQVRTKFGTKQVANATIKDETGEIELSLWEDQINAVSQGDRVRITGGYVKSFKGKLQVAVGRRGKIEVI